MLNLEASNNAIDAWREKLKVSAKQVIEAEEAILKFGDDPDSISILDSAWNEYWEVVKSAEDLDLPQGYSFVFPSASSTSSLKFRKRTRLCPQVSRR